MESKSSERSLQTGSPAPGFAGGCPPATTATTLSPQSNPRQSRGLAAEGGSVRASLPEFDRCVLAPEELIQIMKSTLKKIKTRNKWEKLGGIPGSTLEWGEVFLAKHFSQAPSLMHEWLGMQLDGLQHMRGSKVNVIGPRGSAKSTIASLCYVLRAAVEGWERYIWIVSDTKEQAATHLANVKAELVTNKRLAECYSDSVGQGLRWRANSIELRNKVVIEAFGTGQRIRGRRHNEIRPTLIVCDDLENDSHMWSATGRDASRQWFQGTLLNAGSRTTNLINLATALHREALALVLHRTAGWVSRNFPAIMSWPTHGELWDQWESIYSDAENEGAREAARQFYIEHQAAMDSNSVVLWPAVEDIYALMQLRAEIGRTAFEREKQGSPVNPELCEFPEPYFGEHIWFTKWPKDITIRTVALDPSKGRDARRGDYSAYVLLAIDRQGIIYVSADLARRPTPQLVSDGVTICDQFRPNVFGVESNQFQELLCGEFVSEFARRKISHTVPAAIHNSTNKQVRIRRLGPYLSQRKLRFLADSKSTRLLVEQLRDFPNAAHDDGPDALEMAVRLAEDLWSGPSNDDGLGSRLLISS
jgi:predicted phage terminase large subunit-like protein